MGDLITSARHPRVARARRLAKRAFRTADRAFLVEGPQGVTEALREPGALRELFVTDEAATRYADLLASVPTGLALHRVSGGVMAELAQTVTPQGVVGVAGFRDVALAEVLAGSPRLVVVLAGVRDPGNAGTVLRTADAAGADAVVFPAAAVDPYNPKCVRSSAGSLFHVPLVVGGDVVDIGAACAESGLAVVAADGHGAVALDDADLSGPTAWLFGNEAWGLPAELLTSAGARVRVPVYGRAESLNLAAAAAVCLYASARAQRAPDGCRPDPQGEGALGE